MKKTIITKESVICQTISNQIHQWLFDKEDKIHIPGPLYTNGMDRNFDIFEIVREAYKKAQNIIKKNEDRLDGNIPKWNASVLITDGFGKKSISLQCVEAHTDKEALAIAQKLAEEAIEEIPRAEIIEVKVRRDLIR